MLFWETYQDEFTETTFDWDYLTGQMYWDRLYNVYQNATIFGYSYLSPTSYSMLQEATQSSLGDCYLVAAMSAIAERPTLLEDIFITKDFNAAGIYALKLYIRGKPWIVTVDDTFLFHKK